MGFFDDIKAKVFGAPKVEAPKTRTAAVDSAVAAGLAAVGLGPDGKPLPGVKATPVAAGVTAAAPKAAPAAAANSAPAAAPAPASAPAESAEAVDIAQVLDAAVASKGQKLNWKTSIVDLLKALDIDSSLSARKELAAELGYTGDTGDSATMNVWLHKQVIQKLKDNGGKVPADLL
ncbi:hypothetical protein VE25_15250 [Devosia geojensis]|uniref:DUF3597 domain-containing protein n=1 Tax=Devosia geojensis TaxID=443610 RepID=A0A0F5FQ54_9HYPH|nr:hypothetical protein VE25_15250 [Devosia geojensis]